MLSKPEAFFFAQARKYLFGGSLNQGQVGASTPFLPLGTARETAISTGWPTPIPETDGTMRPITEYGPRSYFNKYEPGTSIGK